jgi:molybdate transport system permease protein
MSSEELQIVSLSLLVGAAAVALLLPFAVGLGWLLARRRFPGKVLLEAVIASPLVLPPVVTGYLLLVLLGRRGWIGGPLFELFGIGFTFSVAGAVVASAVMAFPLAVRSIRLSFEAIDPKLLEAARSLGAPPLAAFRRVAIPLALPGVITGALLAFARSLGEFGATITFAGNVAGQTRTLPLAIYSALQRPGGDAIAARLVAISMALAVGALIASELLARRPLRGS